MTISKYSLQEEGRVLKLALTLSGRLREFVGGALVGVPWALLTGAALFLPDILGKYQYEQDKLPMFLTYSASVLGLIVLSVGLWRALRPVRWEIGDGLVRQYTLGFTGTQTSVEVPMSAVEAVEQGAGQVMLKLATGSALVIARAWVGQGELDALAQRLKERVQVG